MLIASACAADDGEHGAVSVGVGDDSSGAGAAATDAGDEGEPTTSDPQGSSSADSTADASSSTGAPDEPPTPGQVRVVQCNPYYAGRLDPYDQGASCDATADCGDPCADLDDVDCGECIDHRCHVRDWSTARDMAARVRDIGADVIGIEETAPDSAVHVQAILEEATGVAWEFRVVDQGIDGVGSGVGIMWRTDRIELVEDLGSLDADVLATGYILRFAGSLLKPVGNHPAFGMFSGKLEWTSGASEARRVQAERVHAWVDEVMAPHEADGALARIIAVDLNDTEGSPAHEVFASEYDDGDAVKHTIPGNVPDTDAGRRIDYLFWSAGVPGPEDGGFVTEQSDGRLGRSGFFGSDHRFVYGDALVP
jgi:hypothetical protein